MQMMVPMPQIAIADADHHVKPLGMMHFQHRKKVAPAKIGAMMGNVRSPFLRVMMIPFFLMI